MPFDRTRHHRRSVRRRTFDYARAGVYFVTICTHRHAWLFGEIRDATMHRNAAGEIAAAEWRRTATLRPNVWLDAFVVMPNHVHLLFAIVDDGDPMQRSNRPTDLDEAYKSGTRRGVLQYAPTPTPPPTPTFRSPSQTVGAIVRGYKSAVTTRINQQRGTPGAAVWQRNYWDRIVRSPREWENIRRYILQNPVRWSRDR